MARGHRHAVKADVMKHSRQAGFTLLEVLLAAMLMGWPGATAMQLRPTS
ncbi:prepilin-type N-terminal cleavage/methylation domain-containing protein [Aeromonas bivalvium]